jgi:translation initiation factor IF-3
LNEDIQGTQLRLIGADGSQVGIVSRVDALDEAQKAGLDLVLIAPEAEPPVVKVMDYGKHLFDLKKAKAAQRKKQKQIQVKEQKFRPGTEEADYQIKLRNLIRFLEDGDKAKVTLRFRGREMAHPDIGRRILQRLVDELGELATQETVPRMEGNTMHTILSRRVAGKKS